MGYGTRTEFKLFVILGDVPDQLLKLMDKKKGPEMIGALEFGGAGGRQLLVSHFLIIYF
jgi:hypothetical protein